MTEYDNCSKSKAKTMLENKIWAQNSNFWNLNIYPQISVFLLSPSHCYQDRKMKTRGWSPTEFVWRLYQHFLLKMAPMTKELQCFHIKWTHCMVTTPRRTDMWTKWPTLWLTRIPKLEWNRNAQVQKENGWRQ